MYEDIRKIELRSDIFGAREWSRCAGQPAGLDLVNFTDTVSDLAEDVINPQLGIIAPGEIP
jgi:hypothetical protein